MCSDVRYAESRRRVAEQCVLLLRPSATPEQRTRIADHILLLCDYRLRTSRDDMVEPGGIASDPKGKLWRVVSVDDEKIVLKKLRGWKKIELSWKEWVAGWTLKFP